MSQQDFTQAGNEQSKPLQFPQRLNENYKKVQQLLQTIDHDVELDNVAKALERILNDSLPQNDIEVIQRSQEFWHFKRDPDGYYDHILKIKARFLILWTDYKFLGKHFKIKKLIHIRWNGQQYECQKFDPTKRIKALEYGKPIITV